MPIFETAPGVEECVAVAVREQQDVAEAPWHHEVRAFTVKEAVQKGDIDDVHDAIVRETIGYLDCGAAA